MTDVKICRATQNDIPTMAELWREKMILQQQNDRRFTLAPDGDATWAAAAMEWLENECYRVYVAQSQNKSVGYIIGRIDTAPPGLLPEHIGVVADIAVGVHSYQSGLGRLLLEALKDWFKEQGITRALALAPHRQPVEQAFWRALGATELTEVLWIKL